MSQENVEIIRLMYEAYLAGEADRALAFFDADVSVDFTVRGDTGVSRGRDALSQTVATWVGVWDDYSERIEEIHDLGDKVCVIATQRGRGKGSGVELQSRFAQLYELEDGLITSVTMYMDPAKALQDAEQSG